MIFEQTFSDQGIHFNIEPEKNDIIIGTEDGNMNVLKINGTLIAKFALSSRPNQK